MLRVACMPDEPPEALCGSLADVLAARLKSANAHLEAGEVGFRTVLHSVLLITCSSGWRASRGGAGCDVCTHYVRIDAYICVYLDDCNATLRSPNKRKSPQNGNYTYMYILHRVQIQIRPGQRTTKSGEAVSGRISLPQLGMAPPLAAATPAFCRALCTKQPRYVHTYLTLSCNT